MLRPTVLIMAVAVVACESPTAKAARLSEARRVACFAENAQIRAATDAILANPNDSDRGKRLLAPATKLRAGCMAATAALNKFMGASSGEMGVFDPGVEDSAEMILHADSAAHAPGK